MTTFAAALKNEIRRLARKEIKAHSTPTAQAVAQFRREIAKLKREARDHQRKIALLEMQERRRLEKPLLFEPAANGARFSARSVKAQRRRTGLSAADYAKLVGVSALTIYNWEHGKSRPRKEQLASLLALRGLGKRHAQAKLTLFEAGPGEGAAKIDRRARKR